MSEPRNDCPYCNGDGFILQQVGIDRYGDVITDTEVCGCVSVIQEPPKDE